MAVKYKSPGEPDFVSLLASDPELGVMLGKDNVRPFVAGVREAFDAYSPDAFSAYLMRRPLKDSYSTIVTGKDNGNLDVVLSDVAERMAAYTLYDGRELVYPRSFRMDEGVGLVMAPVKELVRRPVLRLGDDVMLPVQGSSPIDNWLVRASTGKRVLSMGAVDVPQKLSLDGHDFVVLSDAPSDYGGSRSFAIYGKEGERILNFDSGHTESKDGHEVFRYVYRNTSAEGAVLSGNDLARFSADLLDDRRQHQEAWNRANAEKVGVLLGSMTRDKVLSRRRRNGFGM